MIIDGIAASEAIDSSGEILVVGKKPGEGCDISDFENGVGLINYEHRGDAAEGASANDIVGKIIYAKKIFGKDDCVDKRQEAYWDHVKLPFIYIKARLYDGAGHDGARALAAAIRDAVMHNEPILARFSIEGSTLKKEGNRLVRTIARKVALTFKPANKSAISGLISDPGSPAQKIKPVTDKQAENNLLSNLLEETVKGERPGHQKLGAYEMVYSNLEVEEDPASLLKMTVLNVRAMMKTMTAGMTSGAPSTLTGGAALQREDSRLGDKERLKNNIRAAVRDYDPVEHGYSKMDMLKFFKFRLPDVNERFLDHFTDLIDDIRTRQVGKWVDKASLDWNVNKAEGDLPEVKYTPRPEHSDPKVVPQKRKGGTGMSTEGHLLSSKLGTPSPLKLYDYGSDPHFLEVIHADDLNRTPNLSPDVREHILNYVHRPWERAMKSWLILNKMAKQGQLPPSVIAHAAIFSAMSPNTSVPIQELYYGHYMDFRKKHGDVFTNPEGIKDEDAKEFHKWLNKVTPPEWFREYYTGRTGEKGGVNFGEKREKRKASSSLELRPQGLPLLHYHKFHPFITALQREVKDDGRAMVDYIMQRKQKEGAKSFMYGFGPKLARYMGLMMGQGNMIIPDRHQLRALFNLPEDQKELAEYAFHALTPVRAETLLRAIDHHFHEKAPAVKKVLEKWPEHFKEDTSQAIGPGFWLQWLAYPHYEQRLGRTVNNLNAGTAHDPFFHSIKQIMDEEGVPHDLEDAAGEPWLKSENYSRSNSLPTRVAIANKRIADKFGEGPASFFFAAWGLPALFAYNETHPEEEHEIRKKEYEDIENKRLARLAKEEAEHEIKQEAQPQQIYTHFRGKKFKPGVGMLGEKKVAIVGNVERGFHAVVPFEKLHSYGPEDIEKVPEYGSSFKILEWPEVVGYDDAIVDAQAHAVPHYFHKKTANLVNGINLIQSDRGKTPSHVHSGINEFGSRWLKNAKGKMVFVKEHGAGHQDLESTAHNEALYHNLADQFFGLGQYIPPVALIKAPWVGPRDKPSKSDYMSVMEAINEPSHWTRTHEQNEVLHQKLMNGDLDKLALMNSILGNTDRHANNYMFGNNDKDLYLIDHGFTIRGYKKASHTTGLPAYLSSALQVGERKGTHRDVGTETDIRPIHPDARKWLLDLDLDKLHKILIDHKTPENVIENIISRVRNMQTYAKNEPNASFEEIWSYPDAVTGANDYLWINRARRRAKIDPEFNIRYQNLANNLLNARRK